MALKSRPADRPARAGASRSSPSLHWTAPAMVTSVLEDLVIEAPLAIEIAYERLGLAVRKVLAVTMRTPGQDDELALGFLLGEGLIDSLADIRASESREETARGESMAAQRVSLLHPPREDLQRVSRGLLTSSACGLCGRPSLEGLPLRTVRRPAREVPLDCAKVAALPELLRSHQPAFATTGGSHGAALCDGDGRLHLAREDVGRHNAVDKLIGAALCRQVPLAGKILVLSGRASFELLQKAAVAGLGTVVAVGAPSSAAVNLAHAAGITLIGFARGNRLNIYAHADRLDLARRGAGLAQAAAPVPHRKETADDRAEALSVR